MGADLHLIEEELESNGQTIVDPRGYQGSVLTIHCLLLIYVKLYSSHVNQQIMHSYVHLCIVIQYMYYDMLRFISYPGVFLRSDIDCHPKSAMLRAISWSLLTVIS